jgi:hypothetical protein
LNVEFGRALAIIQHSRFGVNFARIPDTLHGNLIVHVHFGDQMSIFVSKHIGMISNRLAFRINAVRYVH